MRTYCDMTSGPEGQSVDVDERINEVMRRYGPDSVVTRSIEVAADYLRDAVARAEARAGRWIWNAHQGPPTAG